MLSTASSILDHLDQVAVLSGGLFAGTALYINIGQVPAIREFGLDEYWRFFPHMYVKTALPQAVFATVSAVAAIAHGTRIVGSTSDRQLWFTAGAIFLGMYPYTGALMFPTNKRIINDNKLIQSGKESEINTATRKELLDKWNLLHLGRTVGSMVGFGIMVYGLSRHSSLVLGW